MKAIYDLLKQESSKNDMEVAQLKEACKKEITTVHKELETFLDNLKKHMMAELDKWENDEYHRNRQHISVLETALNLLQTDPKLLEDGKKDGRKEMMFVADVQVSRALQRYEGKLEELKRILRSKKISNDQV